MEDKFPRYYAVAFFNPNGTLINSKIEVPSDNREALKVEEPCTALIAFRRNE
ncbi:hypothetical protein [Priestia endophytica]|jgi:hypothetical protein|uniref:hypothetical protein n=1 Tax=Priestia endophytica TaxID=135735 RepID=UPI001628F647|nr:hypothetical protein [Priestia endophytica]MED4071025.1 hypothetical protein [Priestia endophytica]